MIKQLAWNTFKQTGDINFYLEYVQIENVEKKFQDGINENILLTEEKQATNLGENMGAK